MPEHAEWKQAREALLDEVMHAGGLWEESATVDLEGFGTLTLKVVSDPESGAFDGQDDCHGTLVWPDRHWCDEKGRPSGVDGSGRKLDTRSGPVWWMPPPDVKGDAETLAMVAERARRFLAEDWGYCGLVLSVARPFEAGSEASLWRVESDMTRADVTEIVDSLFAELPPAPPLDPVWLVLRGEGAGEVEVDVFNNEAAAREHAARLGATIVREETVAASAWGPGQVGRICGRPRR